VLDLCNCYSKLECPPCFRAELPSAAGPPPSIVFCNPDLDVRITRRPQQKQILKQEYVDSRTDVCCQSESETVGSLSFHFPLSLVAAAMDLLAGADPTRRRRRRRRNQRQVFLSLLCAHALCFALMLCALCSKSHILVTNSLLHAHALCSVLGCARQKDPNMMTGNTGSERERARLGKSSPCACFVLGGR
jgi:hypothetical protein